ncbi:MAG: tRNA (adenosine(37)-N6)-threonylcarbamoyltransferase complex ATPase subunit type 1 TsaE [Oscillospiraceae bacterium]|nr:tRNA (adenosine(37)-N6)-threonylcarbamoyltransferase complex ATPase subunit type 1 TsaE [Oscillospiraceae bacterium]
MKYISESLEETQKIASEFAKTLQESDVLCMYGDLGAGKTAFVQGLAKGLGIEDHVTSPTFTIVNEYYGSMPLYHFDVYRIADSDEMYEIGYEEYVYGEGVSVIEWPQLIDDILPEKRYEITILKDYDKGEDYRTIEIQRKGYGD